MPAQPFEGFFPEELSKAIQTYFEKFGLECHLREWVVSKIPGMEEFDVTMKIHANRKASETRIT
ncbi:MAG TPA: hypothetical protein PKH07_04730 [bacterium]|nr:hypothetical protein [bacterium]